MQVSSHQTKQHKTKIPISIFPPHSSYKVMLWFLSCSVHWPGSPPFQIVGSQGVSLWRACCIALPQVLEVICLPKEDHRNSC